MMPVAPQLALPSCPLQRKAGTFLGSWLVEYGCMGQKSHIPLISGEPGMVSSGNFLGTRPRPLGLFSYMERASSGSFPRGFGFCRAVVDLSEGALLPCSGLSAACLGVSWESIEIVPGSGSGSWFQKLEL